MTEQTFPKNKNFLEVLLIEDEPALFEVFKGVLQPFHANVQWVKTVAQALRKLHHKQFDLLICDHQLPGEQNGLDLWEIVQKDTPSLPFLMVSGYSSEVFSKLLGGTLSCPPFLTKPFEIKQARTMIEKVLNTKIDSKQIAA